MSSGLGFPEVVESCKGEKKTELRDTRGRAWAATTSQDTEGEEEPLIWLLTEKFANPFTTE